MLGKELVGGRERAEEGKGKGTVFPKNEKKD